MLTEERVAEIERRAEAWAAGLALAGDDDFHAAVESQLQRLTEPPIAKRRATALALAEVGLTEASRNAVFRRPDTVRKRTFYDPNKDWFHGETFRDVLERLVRLYRRWSAGETARRAAADFSQRVSDLRAAEHEIGTAMFDLARQMAGSSLYEVEARSEDGANITLKPARWTFSDLPRVAEGASKLLRLSLDMAPGGRQQMELDWTEHLPDGITPAQAEAAKESWARLLAAADAPGEEEDDE